jgi:hypothetical protein
MALWPSLTVRPFLHSAADSRRHLTADDDGFTEQERAGKKVKLTLMEEVLLLGLKDEQARSIEMKCQ